MPWRTWGDYYSFKEAAIKLHAPTVSGVYGIFNFRHHILIGSAANIRVALLHHLNNTQFRFSRFKPTGFTFEPCAAESREIRAQELVSEYAPIVAPQRTIGLATLWRSLRTPHARAFHPASRKVNKSVSNKIARMSGMPKGRPASRFRFGRTAACAVILLGVGSIALISDLKGMFHDIMRNPSPIAESLAQLGDNNSQAARLPAFSAAVTTGRPGNELIARTLISAPLAQEVPVATDTSDVEEGKIIASAAASAGRSGAPLNRPTSARLQKTTRESLVSRWSVQALAATEKRIANDWMKKLIVKGYDAFVMEAEIRGQTWHRVRVGNFSTRQEAEALRVALITQEGFRDTFVAANDNSEPLLTLHQR